jgi:hypothetical protein
MRRLRGFKFYFSFGFGGGEGRGGEEGVNQMALFGRKI